MLLIAVEEVSRACATTGLILAVQELGSLALKLSGSDEQKDRYLPRLASGEWVAAYALTEAGSGSDSAAMRTEARSDGDEYVLSGSKRFITNAGVAALYTVFAKTDPDAGHAGISCFVVEADARGFEVGRIEPKMGIKGSTTGELFFNDCPYPGGEPRRRGGRGLQDRDADPRPLASRASPLKRWASRRARPTMRSSTRRAARRWASPSPTTSSWRRSSLTWRRAARLPEGSSTRPAS